MIIIISSKDLLIFKELEQYKKDNTYNLTNLLSIKFINNPVNTKHLSKLIDSITECGSNSVYRD